MQIYANANASHYHSDGKNLQMALREDNFVGFFFFSGAMKMDTAGASDRSLFMFR